MSFFNMSFFIFAYLFGSINSAIIVCYILRLPSPRKFGSRNPGTTNVFRIGGKFPAIITLTFDILKGLVPVFVAKILIFNEVITAFIALYAILGHVFPIFFGFKGGKGIATFIGILFGFNWLLGFIFLITWLFVAIITRYSSLSALFSTIITILSVICTSDFETVIPFLIIAIIIIVKHNANIQRLINRQESKIFDKTKVKK